MLIRIGSRESELAVVQSKMVMHEIKKYNSDIQLELVTMKTTGDIILDKTLDKIGGKGLFVKELDRALLENRVDLTVHSYKDMPMEISDELPVLAVSKREDPRDVLILPQGKTEIDFSLPIGCSSLRRKLQLKELYKDAQIKPVRGNVQTRLAKLDSGQYSALVLAYAGIKRLGLESRVSRIFEIDEILPAACQGVLAVQGRKDFNADVLKNFNDSNAFITSLAERSFVRTLDGGCSSPVAAYAQICDDEITITGFYADEKNNCFKEKITGLKIHAEILGQKLANTIRNRGIGQ